MPAPSTAAGRLPAVVATAVALVLACSLLAQPAARADVPDLPTPAVPEPVPVALDIPDQHHPDFVDVPAACRGFLGFAKPDPCWLTPRRWKNTIIVLWGDSHAWQLIPAVRQAARGRRVDVVAWTVGSCPPMDAPPAQTVGSCTRNGQRVVRWLAARKREGREVRVVYATSWELYRNVYSTRPADRPYPTYANPWIAQSARESRTGIPRAFRALGRLGIPTDVVGQMPMVWNGAPRCPAGRFQCDLPRWGVLKDAATHNAYIDSLRRHLTKRGRIIRPARALCDATTCRGRIGGVPVYLDQLHIGQRTSRRLAGYFERTVDDAIAQGRRTGRHRR